MGYMNYGSMPNRIVTLGRTETTKGFAAPGFRGFLSDPRWGMPRTERAPSTDYVPTGRPLLPTRAFDPATVQRSVAPAGYAPPPQAAGPSQFSPLAKASSQFATQLAAQKLGGGSFDFRTSTRTRGMAGANLRTMGQASRTPNAYSGTPFGGYTGKTTMAPTGQYSRLKVLGGGSRGGGMG